MAEFEKTGVEEVNSNGQAKTERSIAPRKAKLVAAKSLKVVAKWSVASSKNLTPDVVEATVASTGEAWVRLKERKPQQMGPKARRGPLQ